MTWVKIDDNLTDHPKLWKLGNRRESATFLFIFALCYSSRNLTDGVVPHAVLESACRGAKQTCAAMAEAGLLEDNGCSYVVHDYLEWNRSKADVMAEREAARVRASRKKFARSSPEVRKPDTDTDTDTEERPKNSCPKPAKPASLDGFEEWWEKYPRKQGKGAARTAYATALKKSDAASLIAGAERYQQSRTVKEGFICLPATWLNQERWDDDCSTSMSEDDAYLEAKYGGAE